MTDIRRRVAWVGILLCLAPLPPWRGAHAARVQPTGESTEAEAPPFVDCGKAQASAAWFGTDHIGTPTSAALEAMSDTDVLHYDLDIELSNLNPGANNCTITGQNRMTIRSKSAALGDFTFRLRSQYTVTSAVVNDVTPVGVSTTSTTTRTVTLDRTYGMDEMFTLTIAYTGTSVSAGLGSILVTNHSAVPIVATTSEPYYAYTWWPTKDGDLGQPGDNSDKATLDISVTCPNNFVVPSNGLLQSVETLTGNRTRYNWSTRYPIATYLVSLAATNYTTWTKNYVHPGGTMPVEFFIYPELDTPSNRLGWERVVDMLGVFGSLFGEYPFIDEKYGLYNFSSGFGGMEHQTMTGQSGFGESLTAHELAHQWWGDAITCKTWSDIWLNEGFATYGACLWEEFKTGTSNPSAYFSAIVARRPGTVNGSVYVYPPDTANVGRIFDGNFSYNKGAWVLHQLRHVVGNATFFQILADYRAAFEGSAATTDEFAAVASATYGQDLAWFFDQWVYRVGAPAYRFGWTKATVAGQDYLHLKIEQTQFPPYPNVFIMPVDLEVTIGASVETVTVWNDARFQWFVLPVTGPPTSVRFDPRQWILRTALTNISLRLGDLDADQDIDGNDYALFAACFTGPDGQRAAGCEPGDFDGDGDIDCVDWEGFTSAWTAPGATPDLPPCADCNANAIPDDSDLATCTGDPACADCNSNAILDECDIRERVSRDADANGIPDECESGACCYGSTGFCADDVPMTQCTGYQRNWSVNTLCAGLDPPCAGACCDLLTGACIENAPSSACSGVQQTWTGGATCIQVACVAATGACCDPDPFTGCTNGLTLAECSCDRCEWTKLASCNDVACPRDSIPTVSAWGLAILSLLLLSGAKIRFGRAGYAGAPQ